MKATDAKLQELAKPLMTALVDGSDTRAAIDQIKNRADLIRDAVQDGVLESMQRYVDSLDEYRLTILTLRKRGNSPTEIARMMNADVRDIRKIIGQILVDLRLEVWPS